MTFQHNYFLHLEMFTKHLCDTLRQRFLKVLMSATAFIFQHLPHLFQTFEKYSLDIFGETSRVPHDQMSKHPDARTFLGKVGNTQLHRFLVNRTGNVVGIRHIFRAAAPRVSTTVFVAITTMTSQLLPMRPSKTLDTKLKLDTPRKRWAGPMVFEGGECSTGSNETQHFLRFHPNFCPEIINPAPYPGALSVKGHDRQPTKSQVSGRVFLKKSVGVFYRTFLPNSSKSRSAL